MEEKASKTNVEDYSALMQSNKDASQPQDFTRVQRFGDEEIECHWHKMPNPPSKDELDEISKRYNDMTTKHGNNFAYCPPFEPRTYIASDDDMEIICQQDVAVTMRDGKRIYCDIYRPKSDHKVPVIVSWGFFGKRPGYGMDDWKIMGVPQGTISKMSKHESSDPGFWCHHGYAVANVDARGSGHSEGNLANFTNYSDAQDGYDFVEWIADEAWCNGKVALYGNSALAIATWFIASTNPPHLACIAPWEGSSDMYREQHFEGGIRASGFPKWITNRTVGMGYIDDVDAMSKRYPLLNGYWKEKIVDLKKIKVPCYCTAGWSHFHLRGAVNGFRKIRSRKKWIRFHREFEWPDAYNTKNLYELKDFFDRYLKDMHNGWEFTPRVRLEVMDAYDFDYQKNRFENEFPLARTQYQKLYLNAANNSMSPEPTGQSAEISYESETGEADFSYAFPEDTELTGYFKLRLWVEARGNDDMDLFVCVKKRDKDGKEVPTSVLGEPHTGAWGKMRVSLRALDPELSTEFNPVQAFTKEEKLSPGEIVPVDIEIVPTSRFWHKGEQVSVQIAGRYIRSEGWFERLEWEIRNKGQHVVHTGGEYDSYLQIPVIPPKYQVGDYIVR